MSWTTAPLLRGLLDDAAVFPPAATPLPDAVRDHGGHRRSWYAWCVGPLLVPAASVAELIAVLTDERPGTTAVPSAAALDVVLVSRPGSDPAVLAAGLHVLRDEVGIHVVAVELGWEHGWRELGLEDVAVVLEVPRGPDQAVAVADVRTAVGEGRPVLAKFRTGATPTWEWPDATELGAFLLLAAGLQVPFKLTGGLHHAVRGTYEVAGVAEENHGVLNVLLATAAALEDAGPEEIAAVLELTDGGALAELVGAWTTATTADVRRAFTAYGCCTVTDPIGELADLGLLPRPDEGPP
ncbi:MAG TPA: hypothetical protein VE503_02475 [Ornithinibacter sp.]|jgi:hypothetical protein|nr:hypothetical protein [Ornithinibacter sp.]